MEELRDNLRHPGQPAGIRGYAALNSGGAVVNHPERTLLRLSGKDPAGMLNAILTNDVPKEKHRGVYAMLLNPKGRILSDLRVLKHGEGIMIVTETAGASAVKETLGRYAPFSRVKLEDLSSPAEPWSILGLYGPEAEDLLGRPDLVEHETAEVAFEGESVLAAGVAAPVPGYDLIGPSGVVSAARDHLVDRGATPADYSSYETARIAAGIPRYGADITPENFPGETGLLEGAVSFGKGCYPGQETVARMHYRGHPNKTLHRLAFVGTTAERGADIIQSGKTVGKITSVAPLPLDDKTLALGYLSRNADLQAPLKVGETTVSSLGPVRM